MAIARALAMEPRVTLFERADSALDPELVEVLSWTRSPAEDGMTIVVVTHEIGFAREVADEVVFMDGEVIAVKGRPSDILRSSRNERTREFLSRVLRGHQPSLLERGLRRVQSGGCPDLSRCVLGRGAH